MKNLRKVLALVLVVASLMGVAVVANADFTDAAKVSASNKQAVDVLSALDIIGGYTDGSYQPGKVVTRAEMAKMIATILNSGKDINTLYKASCTFADSKNHWAAGYIGYCATMGVINGKSADVFAPDAPVTAVEAAKMVLCALKYKAEGEGFTGTNWKGNVLNVVDAQNLFDRVSTNPDEGMTRENAAQLLWNGLQKSTVQYTGGSTITVDGVTFVSGGVRSETGDTLLEIEFPGVAVTRAYDEWRRPMTQISIPDSDPIVAVDTPDLVANAGVQSKKVYELIGKVKGADLAAKGITVHTYNAAGTDDAATINAMTASTTAKIGTTGDRIEIYWDADVKVLDVLVFSAGAIEIADVTVDETNKTTTVTTSSAAEFGYADAKNLAIVFETAETNITEDNEGDVVIVNIAKPVDSEDYALYNLYLPTVVTGASEGNIVDSEGNLLYLYLNGENYNCDGGIDACTSESFISGEDYNVYLDEAGIAHAFKLAEEAEQEAKYAYVIDVTSETDGNWTDAKTTYLAKVLFPNGIIEVIETAEAATRGQLCSYTVDSKNVYTLNKVDDTKETVAITKGQAVIGSDFANKNTVFVVETTVNSKPQYDVYTGIKNVPSLDSAKILVVENAKTAGLLDIVYCLEADLADTSSATDLDVSMLYVPIGLSKYTKYANDAEYSYYSVKAWINGKATTVKLSATKYDALKAEANTADALELIKGYTVDDNGVIIEVVSATASGTISSMTADWKAGIITMNGVKTYIEEGTPVYVYERNSSVFEKHTIEELDVNTGSKAESFAGGWYVTDSNGDIVAIYGVARIY